MPALPPIENLESVGLHPNVTSAYNVCVDFESWATTEQSRIHARVLGYLIIHAPSVTAAHEVAKLIHSCAHDFQTLSDLGSFIEYFIRTCKFICFHSALSVDANLAPSQEGQRAKSSLLVSSEQSFI
jgi:hypothetical protein